MPQNISKTRQFISNAELPVPPRRAMGLAGDRTSIDDLPRGVVAGSNLIGFDDGVDSGIRASAAQALLFAQLVADKKAERNQVRDVSAWYAEYRNVLRNLGWAETHFGELEQELKANEGSVHKAIIPVLTAAFGPAVAAGSLIITALQQLEKMDEDSAWITLFQRQSRRFEVSDFQFSVVDIDDDQVVVHLAGAIFSSEFGQTQVLFFKFKGQNAKVRLAKGVFSASTESVASIRDELQKKLKKFIPSFIREADIGEP